ncbi:MAG: HAD family hydrolase [Mogibacterium sp.]|nr:HAD family hydrolase [Mogibacterium sp.]
MTIKVCIFDMDGTLVRTQESIARPVNLTLAYFGLPAQPVEAFNRFAGDGLKNSLKRALTAAGDTDVAKHVEEGFPMCRDWMNEDPLYRVEPYPYIPEVLRQLKDHGIRVAVLSNKLQESATQVTAKLFEEGLFDYVQGQTDAVPLKPDPSGVYEILRILGVSKEECLYFGDTDTDMMTGRNAGVYTIGVTWGFRPEEELAAYKPYRIIHSAREIPALAGIL